MVSKWSPLDLATLPNCRFIACDPSLTATGLVFIEINDGQVAILDAEKVSTTPTDKSGWEDTFMRTTALRDALRPIIARWVDDWGNTWVSSVNEAPPVGNGMFRTEASILAGYTFREVCGDFGVQHDALVTAHSHKALLCGNGRATKREHGDAIKNLLPEILDGKLITNEALRDALSIALYAAHRKRK